MQIRIRYHDGREECLELDARGTLRFGRRSTADIQLGGPDVRSLHFGILLRDGAFTVVAFKKVGKISVNGKMVRKHILQVGDRIEVGNNRIEVLAERADAMSSTGAAGGDSEQRRRADRRSADAIDSRPRGDELEELSDLDEPADLLDDPADAWDTFDEQGPAAGAIGDELPLGDIATQGTFTEPAVEEPADRSARWWTSTWFKGVLLAVVVIPLVVLIGLYIQQLPDARQRFARADQFYQTGDYPNARKAFATYLRYHGDAPRVDEAIVKRQLAMLLEGLDRGEKAETLLTRLEESMIKWGAAGNCAYAQAGLAELLPTLVADLTRQGQVNVQKGDDEAARDALRKAGETLALVYRYLPPRLQRSCGAQQLQLYYTRLEREFHQPAARRAALQRIEAAMEGGGLEEAYAARAELLRVYPKLATDGRVLAGMRAVGRAEAERVRVGAAVQATRGGERDKALSPEAAWRQILLPSVSNETFGAVPDPSAPDPSAPDSSVTDSSVTDGDSAGNATTVTVVALAQFGVVYGVDLVKGHVLWRRAVGRGATFDPIRIGPRGFVLVDCRGDEVLGVEAVSGVVLWRVPLPNVVGRLTLSQRQLIVASTDGLIRAIDVDEGRVTSTVRMPQHLLASPTIDPTEGRYYQVADHSLVYVVAIDQSRCLSSFYLGHERGTVRWSPIVLGDYLLVFEQVGPNQSVVHVLRRGDQLEPIQAVAVSAAPCDRPVVIGSKVYWAGDDGRVHVLWHRAGDRRRVLQVASAFDPPSAAMDRDVPLRLAAIQGRLWVAGAGVSIYQPVAGDAVAQLLRRRWTDVIVHRIVPTADGNAVAIGKRQSDGPHLVWRGDDASGQRMRPMSVGAAAVAPPLVSVGSDAFRVLRSDGVLVHGTLSKLANGADNVTAQSVYENAVPDAESAAHRQVGTGPTERPSTGRPTTCLWNSRRIGVLGPLPGNDALLLGAFDVAHAGCSLLSLPRSLVCPAVVVGSQLVLPLRHGSIVLYDTQRRRFGAGEFWPQWTGGASPQWRTPAVLPDGKLVVSDGRNRLFLLEIPADGEGIVEAANRSDQVAFASPLVAVEQTVWGVSARGWLCRVAVPELTVQQDVQLRGAPQWGPTLVGKRAFMATTDGMFRCLGQTPRGDWALQLEMGPVVGVCALDDQLVAVASADGLVAFVDASTGSLATGLIKLGQPVAYGPVVLNKRLALLTADGCLMVMRDEVNVLTGRSGR